MPAKRAIFNRRVANGGDGKPRYFDTKLWMEHSDAAMRNSFPSGQVDGKDNYELVTEGTHILGSDAICPDNLHRYFVVEGNNGKRYKVYRDDYSAKEMPDGQEA
jgi:hypothetical protein